MRDSHDETTRLTTSPGHIAEIEHFLFGGRISRARPFRALFTDGATGDVAIMLAQQLADAGITAEVVLLAPVPSLLRAAEVRARGRGLTLRAVDGTWSRLDALDLGAFDYIDCAASLRYATEPSAVLRQIMGSLAPQGGIGLMVLGAIGRRGIDDLQTIVAALAPSRLAASERMVVAKRLLRYLPPTNRYRLGPLQPKLALTDEMLLDRCLGSGERTYRIDALLDVVEGAGLEVAGLLEPARYEPGTYVSDPALRGRFEALSPRSRAAAAEEVAGCLWRHIAYVTTRDRLVDTPDGSDLDLVPLCRHGDGPEIAKAVGTRQSFQLELEGITHDVPLPRLGSAILARIDGHRSARAIFGELRAGPIPALQEEQFHHDYVALVAALGGFGRILLRHPDDIAG